MIDEPKTLLRVQQRACATCIFRSDSSLDLERLLDDVREPRPANCPPGMKWPWFRGHRVCHHSDDAVCAGFWVRYKDFFQLGQIAQRLGLVKLVHDDNQKGGEGMSNKHAAKAAKRKARQRGEAPPGYPSSNRMLAAIAARGDEALMRERISKMNQWRSAVDAANGRLEEKPYPSLMGNGLPAGGTKPVPHQRVMPYYAPQPRLEVVEVDSRVVITQAEFDQAYGIAVRAGLAQVTLTELERLLAMPHPIHYRAQRGYARSK